MRFIKLTVDGPTKMNIFVVYEQITAILDNGAGSDVYISGGEIICVDETPHEIFEKIASVAKL